MLTGELTGKHVFKFSWSVEGDKISYHGVEGQSVFPWHTAFLSNLKGVVHNGDLYYLLEDNGDISIRPVREEKNTNVWFLSEE